MKRITTILALFIVFAMSAQWTTDTDVNTMVVDSEGGDMMALSASNGNTYIVFWEVVAPPENYELRLQILDVEGNQLLGTNGTLISNTIPMNTYTNTWSMIFDSDDNLYIGLTGTGGGEPAYVFKLDSDGNNLWTSDGVNIGSGYTITVLPMTNGEILVSWLSSSLYVVEMQKYDASGIAIWGSIQTVEEGGNSTVPANIFELSNGDYIMVFHSLLNGINSSLYAQRFNDLGEAQWGLPVKISDKITKYINLYDGLQDGDVVYMGYTGITGNRFDSFLQRINADGTLPWGIAGVDFDTNETDYEIDTKITFEEGSPYVWATCVYTNTNQSNSGLYVQKYDKETGARLLTDNAKMVYAIGDEKVHAGTLYLKGDTPLILLKTGMDNGVSPTTLSALSLDENGDFAWPEEVRDLATFSANKSRIQFTETVNDQKVIVFIEDKGDGEKIYAQNFYDEFLSIGDNEIENAIFFVNPVSDNWMIKSEHVITEILIYNVLGQIIYNIKNTSNEVVVNTQNWNSGMYILKVSTDEGVVTKQVIKN